MCTDGCQKFLPVDGLRCVVIARGVNALLPVAGHRVGRECNDETGVALLPEQAGRLVPIHHRHLHIHQDNVERPLGIAFASSVDRCQDLLDSQLAAIVHETRHEPDPPRFGELDRVADQVDEYLSHTGRVACDCLWNGADELGGEPQPLRVGPLPHQRLHIGDELHGRAADELDSELVRLDLGDVQNVVDDVQKMLAAALNRAEPFPQFAAAVRTLAGAAFVD